jgi:hypothetical protein
MRPESGRRMGLARVLLMVLLVGTTVVGLGSCSFFGFLDTIVVQVNGKAVSSYDFGTVTSIPVDATVTIVNKGLFPLTLGGSAAFSVTGTNAGDFSVSGISGDTIEAGSSVSFTLTFNPATWNSPSAAKVTITPTGGAPAASFSVKGYPQAL